MLSCAHAMVSPFGEKAARYIQTCISQSHGPPCMLCPRIPSIPSHDAVHTFHSLHNSFLPFLYPTCPVHPRRMPFMCTPRHKRYYKRYRLGYCLIRYARRPCRSTLSAQPKFHRHAWTARRAPGRSHRRPHPLPSRRRLRPERDHEPLPNLLRRSQRRAAHRPLSRDASPRRHLQRLCRHPIALWLPRPLRHVLLHRLQRADATIQHRQRGAHFGPGPSPAREAPPPLRHAGHTHAVRLLDGVLRRLHAPALLAGLPRRRLARHHHLPFLLRPPARALAQPVPAVGQARPALGDDHQRRDAQLPRVRAPAAAVPDVHRPARAGPDGLLAAVCVDQLECAVDVVVELEAARPDELFALCGVGASAVSYCPAAGESLADDAANGGRVEWADGVGAFAEGAVVGAGVDVSWGLRGIARWGRR